MLGPGSTCKAICSSTGRVLVGTEEQLLWFEGFQGIPDFLKKTTETKIRPRE